LFYSLLYFCYVIRCSQDPFYNPKFFRRSHLPSRRVLAIGLI
jgi:hypothetical protein